MGASFSSERKGQVELIRTGKRNQVVGQYLQYIKRVTNGAYLLFLFVMEFRSVGAYTCELILGPGTTRLQGML